MQIQITPEILATLAGAVLSLLFSYIPGLSTKFASLGPEVKRLIMVGMCAVISVVLYILNCKAIVWIGVNCDQTGVIQLVYIFISTIVANQGTFLISPRTKTVKLAKMR